MSNYVDAVALTERDIGISIFPQTTYTPNDLLVSKVITEPERQVEYVLVWIKNRERSPLVTEFINFVRDTMEAVSTNPDFLEILKSEYLPPENTPYL